MHILQGFSTLHHLSQQLRAPDGEEGCSSALPH